MLDLDPGEGVAFSEVIQAAHDVHDRLKALGFAAFPRTTGGKGLHVVVPIAPRADWEQTKAFCRTFAEAMSQEEPHRFLPTLSKAERRGRILIDYLRNGLGNTAIGSFGPRARAGATVAMPLSWSGVKPGLDPAAFTIRSVPDLLRRWTRDPWDGFRETAQPIPELALQPTRIATTKSAGPRATPAAGGRVSGIVVAHKPPKRS